MVNILSQRHVCNDATYRERLGRTYLAFRPTRGVAPFRRQTKRITGMNVGQTAVSCYGSEAGSVELWSSTGRMLHRFDDLKMRVWR